MKLLQHLPKYCWKTVVFLLFWIQVYDFWKKYTTLTPESARWEIVLWTKKWFYSSKQKLWNKLEGKYTFWITKYMLYTQNAKI